MSKFDITLNRIPAIKDDIGWKGCAYSHLKVIQMAKEKGLSSVLILEDDCKPTEYMYNWPLIQEWLEQNREKWDIFHGGNSYYGFHNNEENTIQSICKIKEDTRLYKSKMLAFHFYYVNSKAYDKMLEYEEFLKKNPDTWMPIDFWPDKQGLDIISCYPFLATQEVDYSNIEKQVKNLDSIYEMSENTIGSIENNVDCIIDEEE